MSIEITSDYLASQGLSETFPDRFWEKVRKTDSCWIWTAAKDSKGYGVILGKRTRVPGHSDMISAHQASWILHFGPIPEGHGVLHKCDNPPCVKPDHLWTGTQLDNVSDMISKKRMPIGPDRAFSKLTWDQVNEIRRLCSHFHVRQKVVAEQFCICQQTVSEIVTFKKYNSHAPRDSHDTAGSSGKSYIQPGD